MIQTHPFVSAALSKLDICDIARVRKTDTLGIREENEKNSINWKNSVVYHFTNQRDDDDDIFRISDLTKT